MDVKSPKKLIEVALPLDKINVAAAREKSIRHGHPSTLHLWWARRPLAAARAVLFAQLVNDPGFERGQGFQRGMNKHDAAVERERLFGIIERLVQWENTNNEEVLAEARAEIWKSWRETCELNRKHPQAAELFNPDKLPAFHDPFAGGGAIPLEAQRLGLEAYASDLNPVAVLINKAMIEIPPKFAGRPPVNPGARSEWRRVRNERGEEEDALSGDDRLAEGDGGGEGIVSAGAHAAQGGDLRDALADHAGSGVDSGEHRRGMDARVEQGKGAVSGDCAGLAGRDRDPADPVRADRLVSGKGDRAVAKSARRGQQNADDTPQEISPELNSSSLSSSSTLTSHSSSLSSSSTLTSHSSQLFSREWKGAQGLAEDVRYYGQWMRDEAEKRIGHLYPKIAVTEEMAKDRPDLKPYVGQELTVIAWLWARTVKSPNPAYAHVDVPLVSSFLLSSKKGKEAWVEPVVEGDTYRFEVRVGSPPEEAKNGTKAAGRGANFKCVVSGTPIDGRYIKREGQANRMAARLMAVVAEGKRGRIYVSPVQEHESIAKSAEPNWRPSGSVPERLTGGTCYAYGLEEWGDLFTPRQLVALTTFSDLVQEAIEKVRQDALIAGMADNGRGLDDGGTGAKAYGEAVGVYLGIAVDKAADYNSTICGWISGGETLRSTFGRQAIPMVWDYCESNFLGTATGSISTAMKQSAMALEVLPAASDGHSCQYDAQHIQVERRVVSTDPPYYDNIGYADLSDFFYVWLRRVLRPIYGNLFATLAVPKSEELVATPYRHGGKEEAEAFFLIGMTRAIWNLAENAHPSFPVTIYYAFKQSETSESSDTTSTGWETFLDAVVSAGFSICGTWPMRTERDQRAIGIGSNALASSIILVCRKRAKDAPTVSRREFIRELNAALPEALDEMTRGGVNSPVAAVDLSQAIIGPGMAIFSKYSAVLEADGSRMSVRTALQLINRFLAEDDFDNDTQFCLHWFEGNGWGEGRFGEADVLARAKGTSVDGVKESGVIESGQGKVRLYRWAEYQPGWDPARDARTPVWEALHHLIRALQREDTAAAGTLLAKMPARAEPIRQLAYRLYTLCERKGWAEDARAYNELITAWTAIENASRAVGHVGKQTELEM